MGVRLKPMPHDDLYKRENAPTPWVGKAQARPDVYEEQEDQWAVLRHEVEGKDMKQRDERVRPGWDQRDTEESTDSSQSPFEDLTQPQHHVDIVVAGVGG